MANETRYYDTNYTFISPVRHFKSNDPYYYEIDNIPIKQLEESQNFLKDQVDGIISKQNNKKEIEIDRSNFSELKPFANGNDRKVRVKPGRYSSRINNAYSLTPLQIIEQIAGFSNTTDAAGDLSRLNTWRIGTNRNTELQAVLDEFQDGLNGAALNMNGLAERSFVFPIDDEDGLSASGDLDFMNPSGPGYSQFDSELTPDERPTYPNYIGSLLQHSTDDVSRDLTLIKNVYSDDPTEEKPLGSAQGTLESAFIKRWRGAIRTSVVDVPEELEISVPDFDLNDYYYFDSAGTRQPLNATQRIDLLFIYSKAVDEESTTIPKFDSNGNPQTLVRAELGILKGAGIGISRQLGSNNEDAENRVDLQTLDGTPIMLAHPGDENSTNNGFATSAGFIRGSFPSPDDLMNLAPVLSENLQTTALPLIGQTILPVAYIRVQTNTGLIADILNDEDIIDIRPFFRTTELAYNERAGIAAATPQISLANPVVSEAHLEKVRTEVFGTVNDRLNSIESTLQEQGVEIASVEGPGNTCRPIAAGNVLGGFWGPEGGLIKHARENTAGGLRNATMNQLVDLVEEEFGYPAGSIPYLPHWDKAKWYNEGNLTGNEVCDHINMSLAYAAEVAGSQNDVKYLPPWKGGRENGQLTTVAQLRNELGSERFAMYHWGENNAGMYSSPSRPMIGIGTAGQESIFSQSTKDMNSTQLESINRRNVQINFVKKRIRLDFSKTPWVSDYQVKVNLLHCIPLCDYTSPRPRGKNSGQGISSARNSCQVWVQKYSDYFVICVAWAGTNTFGKTANMFMPWNNRNDPEAFAGFAQPRMGLRGGGPFSNNGAAAFGPSVNYSTLALREKFFKQQIGDNRPAGSVIPTPNFFDAVVPLLYPSVQWEVVGIPGNFIQRSSGSSGTKMTTSDPIVECL